MNGINPISGNKIGLSWEDLLGPCKTSVEMLDELGCLHQRMAHLLNALDAIADAPEDQISRRISGQIGAQIEAINLFLGMADRITTALCAELNRKELEARK